MPARAGNNVAGGDVARPTLTDRITVALIPQAAEDLQHLQDQTGLSKTDIVNRAISLYDFVNTQQGQGSFRPPGQLPSARAASLRQGSFPPAVLAHR